MTTPDPAATVAQPTGIHHVRLTVTDIGRSREFYRTAFGVEPDPDFSDQAADPAVRQDPEKLYGGCVFTLGSQILGLRPVAEPGDRFESTRVGLDHISLELGSLDDLEAAAKRLAGTDITHGQIKKLPLGIAILSFQDPDDINLELTAPLPESK